MTVSDKLWTQLLSLKSMTMEKDFSSFFISFEKSFGFFESTNEQINATVELSNQPPSKKEGWVIENLLDEKFYIAFDKNESLETINAIKLYTPIILLSRMQCEKPFIMVHMAQSLDGRISTAYGNSKWIGNDENLIHAHRIRALVDAVLVGGNTISNDLPRLNVRHVKGENPCRLFLSNSFNEWNKLPKVENAMTILIRKNEILSDVHHPIFDNVIGYNGSNTKQRIDNILKRIRMSGIKSILIEGGPKTIGDFFTQGTINWFQLHITPVIFGSGISCLSLPEIVNVEDSTKLNNVFYVKMGNAMMITGELLR